MEDEVDAALDMELEASFLKSVVTPGHIDSQPAICPGLSSSSSTISPPASRLTFSFPDWAIDICEDAKRRRVSILRHSPQLGGSTVNVLAEDKKAEPTPVIRSFKTKAWKLEADSGVWKLEDLDESSLDYLVSSDRVHIEDREAKAEKGLELERRTSCNELPHELLTNICRRLNIRDLCAAIQTCRRWNFIGLEDELWKSYEGDSARFINSSDKGSPRWTFVKNMILSDRVSKKFYGYRKGFEFLRYAMNSWWDLGKPEGRFPASVFRTVMQKLTVNNWSLLYEGFGVIFIDRTDWIASLLLREFGDKGGEKCDTLGHPVASKEAANQAREEQGEYVVSRHDGLLLWQAVETYWRRFKRWLTLVVSHCRELNHEVMAERARSHAWVSTPTLYDGGVICFRSQIVLRYRLCHALQVGYSWLKSMDKTGSVSDQQVELLMSVHHLLQELDVRDDFTLSPTGYTQDKLRRCFCSHKSMTRKLQKQELSVLLRPTD